MSGPSIGPPLIWRRRTSFVLASAGAAIGLGNFWRLPYLAAEHGGLAFLLVYVLALLLIGLPLLSLEMGLGRLTRRDPLTTGVTLVETVAINPRWRGAGGLTLLAALVTLASYGVVGGICLAYIFDMAFGAFNNQSTASVVQHFSGFIANEIRLPELLLWHLLFLMLVVAVSMRGVIKGLERALTAIVPMIVLLLVGLLLYAASVGQIDAAWDLMAHYRPEDLRLRSIVLAFGQAFFTLSLGMGVMLVYGSYMPSRSSICASAGWVILLDFLVAVMAGIAILALSLPAGQGAQQGFALIFVDIPQVLGSLPAGQFVGSVFFVMLALVAWSSAIGAMEPMVAWRAGEGQKRRIAAVLLVALAAWGLGVAIALSFSLWRGFEPFGISLFRWLDFTNSGILLPLNGLLMAILAGYLMGRARLMSALNFASVWRFRLWYAAIHYLVPIILGLVLLVNARDFALSVCDGGEQAQIHYRWCGVLPVNVIESRDEFPSPLKQGNQ